ncbi:MAG: peptide chain release factor N(5)-glutamine methyltransferase [Bacteroidales bacterium]|nr:peptide chain release factor N(5)-glutamine methyltransferase [Bacteroidales bacterium]
MRIKTNALKSVRDFFDDELKTIYSSDEIRYYFYWCCEHFLNLSKTQVISDLNFRISESMMLKFNFAVKDLKKQKPIQYILETCGFFGLSLHVTPDVLIPRPETEELVQKIVNENKNFEGKILDICTGSGCIALALKKQFPNADVYGLDISEKAIQIAKENAEKNHLNIDFFVADIFNFSTEKRFDLIVSNPPYVRYSEKSKMQANVLDYEPHQALFVDDENPLIFYTAITNFEKKHLKPNGKLYFEINEKFSVEISELLKNTEFSNVEIFKDFREKDRYVVGTKYFAN